MSAPRYKWQPSTAEIAVTAGIPVSDVVRFDHNTSPFSTEWASDLVAKSIEGLNEYPAASYLRIREAASAATGLPPERVCVGAGVDELLLLAGRAFLGPHTSAVAATPTYPLYEISTLQVGAKFVRIATPGPDFAFPLDRYLDATRDADVAWLCVPNNPTGHRLDNDSVAAVVAATDGIVVLDAAYAEFSGDDWSPWVERHHNLLVLHTLSKGYGVGGIRVGYGLAHPDLIDAIDAVRPPGSISSLSVDIAVGALAGQERMHRHVNALITERARLESKLAAIGFRVLPSHTNFLLCDVGPSARDVGAALMAEGLVARMYPAEGTLADYLRFTVRSPRDNDRLLEALGRHVASVSAERPSSPSPNNPPSPPIERPFSPPIERNGP